MSGSPGGRAPRWSLRTALLAGVVAATTAALLAAGAASVVALRAYLMERTDDQVRAAAALVTERGRQLGSFGEPGSALRSIVSPTQYLVEIRQPDGEVTRISSVERLPPRPLLGNAPTPPHNGQSGVVGIDAGPAGRFRAITVDLDGTTVLVGLPLRPVRDTVRQLIVFELVAGAAVLGVLVVLARLLIVRRLRPLEDITATATAIAGGDLGRRVAVQGTARQATRTEVGRLSTAVNGMLARIQTALADRAASEERMRRFAADASHELRTPLTSIRGYLHLLRTGMVDTTVRPDVLRRVDEEATRMSKLVDDLLYLARLDAEPRLRHDRLDLAVIVRDSVSDAVAVQPDRRLDLVTEPGCLVDGDEDTLRQVVANLLANLRIHTPPGTPAEVRVRRRDGRVVVSVADHGPGLPDAVAARVFDRFYRADAGRGGGGGSGLGLAIVAESVRVHGGEVGVDSALGSGATFWFSLPQARDPVRDSRAEAPE